MATIFNTAMAIVGGMLIGFLVIGAIGFFAEVPKQLKRIADALERRGADDR